MVVEADESDGTFLKLPATISVVTNIDKEHLDFYKNFSDLDKKVLKNLSIRSHSMGFRLYVMMIFI